MDDEKQKLENVANYSKWHGQRKPLGYNRPGRKDKAEKQYRRNKTHLGKGITLRSHRPKDRTIV